MKVAAVVIGRNEGVRLERCLISLKDSVPAIVYVDSGSTDGSADLARRLGADVVDLDMSQPFSAARSRNAGVARLNAASPEYIQVVDGDCELDPDWIETALAVIDATPDLALVCGRRREKFPDVSLWNQLIDAEWDTPVGETDACGGDALIRRAALVMVGGYRDELIAGEEPEVCYRMRRKGWRIVRLDAEMTRHDAAMTRFSQWWKRSRRAGHAYAEVAALHWGDRERYYRKEVYRSLIWGLALPLAAILSAILLSPWFLLLFLGWPMQVVRLAAMQAMPLYRAFFLTLAKLPEALGMVQYWVRRLAGKQQKIIEYR